MPWIKDVNGDNKYISSYFHHHHLPTWQEIYEFYQMYIKDRNINNITGEHIYWKIPNRTYYLIMMCNQFNKMLYEDQYLPQIITQLENLQNIQFITAVKFILLPVNSSFDLDKIYDHVLSNHIRYSIEEEENSITLKDLVDVSLYLYIRYGSKDEVLILPMDHNTTKSIIDNLSLTVMNYFIEPVGWKDENGNLLSDRQINYLCNSGYDPAL